jgi:hypothetical protein
MQILKTALDTADLSSRAKRRKTAALAAGFLSRIRSAEEAYMMRIPENLPSSDAYENADHSIGLLDEAIDAVNAAYD